MSNDYELDLTPFGFTPTQGLVYAALLREGTSSGYAVAKRLGIARANTYQALEGLVAGGAAVLSDQEGPPKLYRAVSPRALVALLAERGARHLDRVEQALRDLGGGETQVVTPFAGDRALEALALRSFARLREPVSAVAPNTVLARLAPLWRKRAADGHGSALWSLGRSDPAPPHRVAGVVDPELAAQSVGAAAVLLAATGSAIVGRAGNTPRGFWTSDPVLVATCRAAIEHLTRPAS